MAIMISDTPISFFFVLLMMLPELLAHTLLIPTNINFKIMDLTSYIMLTSSYTMYNTYLCYSILVLVHYAKLKK